MIEIRRCPTCNNNKNERAGHRLIPDEAFEVAEERADTEAGEPITYLRLADGRGWLFDKKPGVGVMCLRQEEAAALAAARPAAVAPVGAPAAAAETAQLHGATDPVAEGDALPPLYVKKKGCTVQ
eukprot:SRR837773.14641.p2 GENE.SRR837773.14641~~SRR837773.14641.p2  ORF type:complete len:125 (-),score=34.86 SRR837773.14641:62-436(-)